MSTGTPTIAPASVNLFGFDSLTATLWYDGRDNASSEGHPNLPDLINANWAVVRRAHCTGRRCVSTGRNATSAVVENPGKSITVVNSGVSGNRIADVLADLNARVIAHAPDVIWFFCTLNDATGKLGAVSPTDLTVYMASVASFVTQVRAALPNCQIIMLGAMCDGELWADNPPRFSGNSLDTNIDAFNTALHAYAVATDGCYWAGIRDWAAGYESVHNTPAPGVATGIITRPGDGAHQRQVGALAMDAWAYTQVSVSQ